MTIQLDHLVKKYGRQTVVNDVSLEIEQGELFVLLGASGSGKSTILRIIAGLTSLDSGSVQLNGRDVTRLSPQQRDTGFVFQNYSLFRHLNAAANIEFGLKVRKAHRKDRQARVTELLNMIGLDGLGGRMPAQLSGGQQQRVALARALAPNPSVLLLDEPFGALDVKIRGQLRHSLREIQQQLQITTILVTHDQEEAFELADRIGIIDRGVLLEVGTPAQLYRRPKHLYTANFLGTANVLNARRNGKTVYVGQVSLPAPSETEHLQNQDVHLVCRPEEIDLALEQELISGSLIGRGRISNITFAGSLERATVQLMDISAAKPLHVLLSPEKVRSLGAIPGQEVFVGIQDFHLLPFQEN